MPRIRAGVDGDLMEEKCGKMKKPAGPTTSGLQGGTHEQKSETTTAEQGKNAQTTEEGCAGLGDGVDLDGNIVNPPVDRI